MTDEEIHDGVKAARADTAISGGDRGEKDGGGMKKKKLSFAKRAVTAYLLILAGFAFAIVVLAYIAVWRGFEGSLGYLAYPFTALSAAGGAILPAYFSKSAKENTVGGIVYDAAKAKDFESV